MPQARNPNDKTFPKTVHMRVSVLTGLAHWSGVLDKSHGEIVDEALRNWFEVQEAMGFMMNLPRPESEEERDANRKKEASGHE